MSETIRTGQASFVPRARLLKLLGGELIRDDVMALVELIKNSHDADATQVTVTFEAASRDGGSITVADDGHGMGVEQLLRNWMQPAGSSKRKTHSRRTDRGRRVLGEKGVGRFAVDRLGRRCELLSRQPGSETEIVARFDWDAFDNDDVMLSEVLSEWEERTASDPDSHGTIIHISDLRQPWNQRAFRRLSSRVMRLLSPFREERDFSVTILSDEFPDYSGLVQVPYLDLAPYRIDASFDGLETIQFELNGMAEKSVWPGPGYLKCGPVSITLRAFDLETEALRKLGAVQDVRAWLREWSGITIYRDGFRVLPYGEPDDDWLRLDQRRVNNPVVRLSNNQISAVVEITGDGNPDLRDQTNRGGLIQNRAFEDLRRLVLHVLEIVEMKRRDIRHPQDGVQLDGMTVNGEDSVDSVLRSLRQHSVEISRKSGFSLGSALDTLSKAYHREKKNLLSQRETQSEVLAVGHNASFLVTALRADLSLLESELQEIEEAGKLETVRLLPLQSLVADAIESLELLEPLQTSVHEHGGHVDLIREIRSFTMAAARIAGEHNTEIDCKLPANRLIMIDGTRYLFWHLLTLLLRNSLQALTRSPKKKIEVRLKLSRDRKNAVIIFRDTGHGIPDHVATRIFEPGYTTRKGARGLGLTIGASLTEKMNGNLKYLAQKGGGEWTAFELKFPLSSLVL
jgi:signal transduction histidine kinase